ncbi:MAG: hypothetical protein ACRDWH_09515, partial [Acidimicrobiia bacterium]
MSVLLPGLRNFSSSGSITGAFVTHRQPVRGSYSLANSALTGARNARGMTESTKEAGVLVDGVVS